MGRFTGKTAIVTGAAQGIGRAIAERFLDEGGRVLAVDIKNDGLLSKPADDRFAAMAIDITIPDASASIVAQCVTTFGAVDILVNNAGIGDAPSAHETTDEIFDRYIGINLRAAFRLSRDVLPELRKSHGNIVNIASSLGLSGYRRSAAYSASKGGMIALSRNMASDYGAEGIRVNAVAPGPIVTPMTEGRLKMPRFQALIVGTMPLGKVGKPEDVAAAVAFLASDEAGMITGQTLAIDGGQTTSVFLDEKILAAWEAASG